MKKINLSVLLALVIFPVSNFSLAEIKAVDNTTVTSVSVNGGADSANPGVTCLKVSYAVSQSCTNGYVAIPNNNAQLLSAALAAKSTGAKVWLYYADSSVSTTYHCPGLAFTPCSVISIAIHDQGE